MAFSPLQRSLAGACCLAAGGLAYLLPGALARSHAPAASTPATGTRTTTPSPTPRHAATGATPRPSTTVTPSASSTPSASRNTGVTTSVRRVTLPSQQRNLPAPVTSLHLAGNTWQTFTVAWTPSSRATRYRVLLDGHQVAVTTDTTITLPWSWTTDNLLVQVAPVAANGLLGEWRALVVVPLQAPAPTGDQPTTAPTSSPTATATTAPSASTTPSASASATTDPSASSSGDAAPADGLAASASASATDPAGA